MFSQRVNVPVNGVLKFEILLGIFGMQAPNWLVACFSHLLRSLEVWVMIFSSDVIFFRWLHVYQPHSVNRLLEILTFFTLWGPSKRQTLSAENGRPESPGYFVWVAWWKSARWSHHSFTRTTHLESRQHPVLGQNGYESYMSTEIASCWRSMTFQLAPPSSILLYSLYSNYSQRCVHPTRRWFVCKSNQPNSISQAVPALAEVQHLEAASSAAVMQSHHRLLMVPDRRSRGWKCQLMACSVPVEEEVGLLPVTW